MTRRIIPRRPIVHHDVSDPANARSKLALAFDTLLKTVRRIGDDDGATKLRRPSTMLRGPRGGRGTTHLDAEIDDAVEGSTSGENEGGGEGGGGQQGDGSRGHGGGAQSHDRGGDSGGQGQRDGGGNQGDGHDAPAFGLDLTAGGALDERQLGPLTARQADDRHFDGAFATARTRPQAWAIADFPGAWKSRSFKPFDPFAALSQLTLPPTIRRWVTADYARIYTPGPLEVSPAKPSTFRLYEPARSAPSPWPALPPGLELRRREPARAASPFLPSSNPATPARRRAYDAFVPLPRRATAGEGSPLRRHGLENRVVAPAPSYMSPVPMPQAGAEPRVPRWLKLDNRIFERSQRYGAPAFAAMVRAVDVKRRMYLPPSFPSLEDAPALPPGFPAQGDGDGRLPPMSMDSLLLLLGQRAMIPTELGVGPT